MRVVDPYDIEDRIREIGEPAVSIWFERVRPELERDPIPTNPNLAITRTLTDQVWLPGTDLYVAFVLLSDGLLLVDVVDVLGDDLLDSGTDDG